MKDIGDLTLYKGKLGDIQLIMWDALPNCTEECTIYQECPYEKMKKKRLKCEMRRRYLESVMKNLEKAVKIKDEINTLTVGLMVAPLFQQLINFKIFEHGMSHTVMLKNKVHPIYREIRQTIQSINALLRDLGLGVNDKKNNLLDGNSDYYDSIIEKGQIPS